MGVMVDAASRLPRHILAIGQVEHAEDDPRYRQYGKEQDLAPRVQKDGREQDGRHRTGSADRDIIRIIAPPDQVIKGGCDHAAEIQSEVSAAAKSQIAERTLHIGPERPESEHVHEEVRHVGMDKSMRDQPVPFMVVDHTIGDKGQLAEQLPVPEAEVGHDDRDPDNTIRNHISISFSTGRRVSDQGGIAEPFPFRWRIGY